MHVVDSKSHEDVFRQLPPRAFRVARASFNVALFSGRNYHVVLAYEHDSCVKGAKVFGVVNDWTGAIPFSLNVLLIFPMDLWKKGYKAHS